MKRINKEFPIIFKVKLKLIFISYSSSGTIIGSDLGLHNIHFSKLKCSGVKNNKYPGDKSISIIFVHLIFMFTNYNHETVIQ